MDWKVFLTVFGVVFLAELGDKTQLATMLFATNEEVSRWLVFFAAAAALILSSAIAVVVGGALAQWVSPKLLSLIAGAGFVLIGLLTLWQTLSSSG